MEKIIKNITDNINSYIISGQWNTIDEDLRFNIIKEFIIAFYGENINPGIFVEIYCAINYGLLNGYTLAIKKIEQKDKKGITYEVENSVLTLNANPASFTVVEPHNKTLYHFKSDYLTIENSMYATATITFDKDGLRKHINAWQGSSFSLTHRYSMERYEEDTSIINITNQTANGKYRYFNLTQSSIYPLMKLPILLAKDLYIPDYNRENIIEQHFPEIKEAAENLSVKRD